MPERTMDYLERELVWRSGVSSSAKKKYSELPAAMLDHQPRTPVGATHFIDFKRFQLILSGELSCEIRMDQIQ